MKTRGYFQSSQHNIDLLHPCSSPVSTASPQIMSFDQNIDERKKELTPSWGHCLCGVCTFSPSVGFLWGLWFPPTPQTCTGGELACPHCPIWVCVCECLQRKGVLSRVGPALCPELPGWAPPPSTLNRLENHYLTYFYTYFLNVCKTHIYFNVWGLYLEVWWCLFDQKYTIET